MERLVIFLNSLLVLMVFTQVTRASSHKSFDIDEVLRKAKPVAWAIPPPPPTPEQWMAFQNGFSSKYSVNNTVTLDRRGTTFKYKYVLRNGAIYPAYTTSLAIEVAATGDVSDLAHKLAAITIARLTKHMPPSIFLTLAAYTKVGVFTRAETLLVYPEYAGLATPPGCEYSCFGNCSRSCTFDGRKYFSLAGVGGMRAVVVDDNVLCNSYDPYGRSSNILVHEFTHTIHSFGISETLKKRITSAYAHAKANNTWQKNTYSMSNEQEYFAVASQTFFSAEQLNYTTGGMNSCGQSLCQTETEGRQKIREKDPELYAILSEVYTNNRPSLPSYLSVCTKVHI